MKKKLVLLLVVVVFLAGCHGGYEWQREQAVPAEKCVGYAFSLYVDSWYNPEIIPDVFCIDLYEYLYHDLNQKASRYEITTWAIIGNSEHAIQATIYTSHAWVVDNATGQVSEIGRSPWQED